MNTLNEKMDEINREFAQDIQFDLSNMSEKLMIIPAIKHKWVGRYMDVKFKIKKLSEERERIIAFETKEIGRNIKIGVTEAELKKVKIDNNKRLNDEIDPNLADLRFLESFYKPLIDILTYNLTKDITNMLDMHKLETL